MWSGIIVFAISGLRNSVCNEGPVLGLAAFYERSKAPKHSHALKCTQIHDVKMHYHPATVQFTLQICPG